MQVQQGHAHLGHARFTLVALACEQGSAQLQARHTAPVHRTEKAPVTRTSLRHFLVNRTQWRLGRFGIGGIPLVQVETGADTGLHGHT